MKIAKAETVPLSIPFSHGAEKAGFNGQDWSRIYILLIRVETDEGLVGWGDAFAYSCGSAVKAAFESCVAPLVVGKEVDDIGPFMHKLAQPLHLFGQNGVMQYALSGLDIALWDLKAKQAGLPLRDILGPGRRDVVEGYSSLFKYNDVDMVIEKCRESLDKGFTSIKLHETTVESSRAAREVCGATVALMVDVNCPWDFHEALERANALKEFDIRWLEEPLYPPDDYAGLARLQKDSGVALAAGENACGMLEFTRMISTGAVTYVQPSVTKLGGISTFLKVQALCRENLVSVQPHSPYYGPGFLATMHLAAAAEQDTQMEWFLLELEAYPHGECMLPRDGIFHLQSGVGLGSEPAPDVIRDYGI